MNLSQNLNKNQFSLFNTSAIKTWEFPQIRSLYVLFVVLSRSFTANFRKVLHILFFSLRSFCWFSCFVGMQSLHLTHGFQAQKGRHFV
ncbi:hypothetical protein LEP1GSC161_2348 [Leptospira santarosai str. CBC1416]|uniref:Uncharacterized protein n=1 Tax=Leptospira santarosai str. CBC1416 TaxID=1193059 RepID=M6VR01_9LEPT|nr:hypothetical protein LEP1GSC161_2348 [Leptospira santarosai str. CBC1416]